MAVKVYFHCVWSVKQHCFTLTVGKTTYNLTPTQMKSLIAGAKAQVKNIVSPVGDLDLDFGENRGYKFTGIDRNVLIEYLSKVYDGWNRFTFANDGQNKGKVKP